MYPFALLEPPTSVFIVEVIRGAHCSYRLFEHRPSAIGFATRTSRGFESTKPFVYEGLIGEWQPLPQYVDDVAEHALSLLGDADAVR